MTGEAFAQLLLRHVVDDPMRHFYARQARQPVTKEVTDPLWRALQTWVPELPPDRLDLILAFARQCQVDAISHVLGVLDGSSSLPGVRGEFTLLHGKSTRPLNGDLQDGFLAAAEDAGPDAWLRRATAKRRRKESPSKSRRAKRRG